MDATAKTSLEEPEKPLDFRQAIADGDNAAVTDFLNRYPDALDRMDGVGLTPLMTAAWCQNPATVKLLLERGADVNKKSFSGWTALMVAAVTGNKDIIEMLLERGADIGVVNTDGRTALTYASSRDAEVVEWLKHWPQIKRARFLHDSDFSKGLKKPIHMRHPFKISPRKP